MLRIVSGAQRSGKSLYCVREMCRLLKSDTFTVATNLPIYAETMLEYTGAAKERLIVLTDEEAVTFWRNIPAHCAVFLDETYELWLAKNSGRLPDDIRSEAISYGRQHGHTYDELYFVSHDPTDIDKAIRKGCQEYVVIRRSTHEDIFGGVKWLKWLFNGLKWPVYFILVEHYSKCVGVGETKKLTPYRTEWWRPDKALYQLYNSHSQSAVLVNSESGPGEKDIPADAANADEGSWWHYSGKPWIKSTWPLWCAVVIAGVLAWRAAHGVLDGFSKMSSPPPAAAPAPGTAKGVSGGQTTPRLAGGNGSGSGVSQVGDALRRATVDDRPVTPSPSRSGGTGPVDGGRGGGAPGWVRAEVAPVVCEVGLSIVAVRVDENHGIPLDYSATLAASSLIGRSALDWRVAMSLPETVECRTVYAGRAVLRSGEPWRLTLGETLERAVTTVNTQTDRAYTSGYESDTTGLKVELTAGNVNGKWWCWLQSSDRQRQSSAVCTVAELECLVPLPDIGSCREAGRMRSVRTEHHKGPWGLLGKLGLGWTVKRDWWYLVVVSREQ